MFTTLQSSTAITTNWINDDNKLNSYKNHRKNEFESIRSYFISFPKFTRTYRCLKRKLKYLNDLKNIYFSKIKTPYNYLLLNLTIVSLIWLLISIFTYDDVKAAVKAQNLNYSIVCEDLSDKPLNYSSSYNYHKEYFYRPSNHHNYKKTAQSCPCKLLGHCLARKPPNNFQIYTNDLEFSQFKEFFMHPVQMGGYWRPPKCIPDFDKNQLDLNSIDRVTFIIVPFMNLMITFESFYIIYIHSYNANI